MAVAAAVADPVAQVAAVEAGARRYETACDEGVMAWRLWGEGPAVLLAHGAFGSWTHWIRNIPALVASGRTVIVPDLPGFGESALPADDSHAHQTGLLAKGLAQVAPDAQPVDLVGFSYGGVMLAWLAALHPGLGRRLVLIGSGGLGTPFGNVETGPIRGLEGEALLAQHRANLLGMMLHSPDSADALAVYLHAKNIASARLRTSAQFVVPDRLIHILPKVGVPVDSFYSTCDRPHPNPPMQEAAIKSVLPDAHCHTIENAGHWSIYEQADIFNAALLKILDDGRTAAR